MNKLMCVVVLMLASFGWSSTTVIPSDVPGREGSIPDDGTEYWALLVGCNEFRYQPGAYLPGNDRIVRELKDTLLVFDQWHEDHIRVLTGKDTTKRNIIDGLKWMDEMDDEDDICFFYISTHGTSFRDMYPKDEYDWMDEYLLTYDTYIKLPLIGLCSFGRGMLRDDEINRLFSNLESPGIFAIFDTCYSGGFNDPPSTTLFPKDLHMNFNKKISAINWMNDVGRELSGAGRVILMSADEREIAQGTCFGYFCIEAMQGRCDANNDTVCTGEEIFTYASSLTTSWLKEYKEWDQHPQIYDNYPGDLQITISNLPPSKPTVLFGANIGTNTQEYQYIVKAFDPEDDRIKYHINWGDNNKEVTNLYDSGMNASISHRWDNGGTFNIWVEAEDENGAMIYQFGLPYHFSVMMCDDNQVDQYQTKIYQPEGFYDCMIYNDPTSQCIQAQSFKPTLPTLTKVDLWLGSLNNATQRIKVAIRSDLKGDDITSISNIIPIENLSINTALGWTTFDFPDVEVTPGETYYIVCSPEYNYTDSTGYWMYGDPDYPSYPNPNEDPYTNGQAYKSTNGGLSWISHTRYADDFCFVTYGK